MVNDEVYNTSEFKLLARIGCSQTQQNFDDELPNQESAGAAVKGLEKVLERSRSVLIEKENKGTGQMSKFFNNLGPCTYNFMTFLLAPLNWLMISSCFS